ncbi:hypothetical protein PVAND_016999 [Polypedilum vanderplanki]|uniref:C2H2-type domain-containing protein n=1 Tax=Polypedilum vanderplanki TaxID=319348 RepID=A0A9J6BI31_POLVA|nr:hypothetical protein PVAND_016999 [Polypedilum vanderplanki]
MNFQVIPITKSKTFLRKSTNEQIKIENERLLRNEMKVEDNVCELCNKKFSSKKNLQDHKILHGEKKYECPKCDLKFHRIDYIKGHLKNHINFRFKCQICAMDFFSYAKLHAHQLRAKHGKNSANKKVSSESNSKILAKPEIEEQISKIHQISKPKQLNYIEKLQWTKSQNSNHQQQKTKIIKCPNCDLKFESVMELNQHCLSHRNLNYNCVNLCEMKFSSFINLKAHQNQSGHKINSPVPESKCLQIHQEKTGHKNPQKSDYFECLLCGIKLTTLRGLSYHLRRHDKFTYSCIKSCGMKFSKAVHLRAHQWKNGHGNPPKSFNSSNGKCEKCGISFERSKFYYEHMKKDHEKFIYKCDECEMKFMLKRLLTKHQKITGHKNNEENSNNFFQCMKCGMKFTWEIEFNQHWQHHDDFKYLCDICGIKFPRNRNLMDHKKKVHPEEIEVNLSKTITRSKSVPRDFENSDISNDSQENYEKFSNFDSEKTVELFCDENIESEEELKSELNETRNFSVSKVKDENIRIHDGIKILKVHKSDDIFPCPKCDKMFNRFYDVKRHLKNHDNFKFVCQVNGCKMRFGTRIYLNEHKKRSHEKIRRKTISDYFIKNDI